MRHLKSSGEEFAHEGDFRAITTLRLIIENRRIIDG
jgi:hypothetical protein